MKALSSSIPSRSMITPVAKVMILRLRRASWYRNAVSESLTPARASLKITDALWAKAAAVSWSFISNVSAVRE